MYKPDFSRVLDRTPVLLGPGRYLLNITDQAVKISAIDTVHFFQAVQITEVVPVEDNIVFTIYFRDSIYWETDRLVKRHHHIHENSGKQTRPDHRRSQNI